MRDEGTNCLWGFFPVLGCLYVRILIIKAVLAECKSPENCAFVKIHERKIFTSSHFILGLLLILTA